MSEEEKEAIEDIDLFIHCLNYGEMKMTIASERQKEIAQELQLLLNLLNKQQKEIEEKSTILLAGSKKVKQLEKEIEELKEKNAQLTNYLNDSYYVSADKIKEKLKELEEQKEKLKYDGNRSFADYEQFCKNLKFFKEQIEELLEENK